MRAAIFPYALCFVLAATGLNGCGDSSGASKVSAPAPFVRTVAVEQSSAAMLGLSGVVRAQTESPLSFQVAGRITARRVDAGQRVRAGDVLFELDKRDFEQGVLAARSSLAAADLALNAAQADLDRHNQLLAKNFISPQAMERVELTLREARTRREVAMTHVRQAGNTLGYGQLRAPAAGVLVDVSGEVGQVVAAGLPIALLAQAGAREVEVHFPERVSPPPAGVVVLDDHQLGLKLREQAGAVDPEGRTLRVRYTITEQAESLQLGAVVRTRFSDGSGNAQDFSVPLAALSERGSGARVWLVTKGKVSAIPVTVLALDAERAHIRGPLKLGDSIVALGTHLLVDGMAVRTLHR